MRIKIIKSVEGLEEVKYVGGQWNFQNKGFNLSYKTNNVDNPGDQFYPPRNNQHRQQFQEMPFVLPQGFQNKTVGYGNTGF